nr:enoyl-CoA hydratase-related protein [Acidiplasma sp.]
MEIININNETKRNALSKSILLSIYNELNVVSRDKTIKVVVIKSNGPVFSSGHDLNEILHGSSEDVMSLFNACGDMMKLIRKIPQVVIASVQGIATAAGCQLGAACDLAICSESAKFAAPGISVGLFCSTPSMYLARNVPIKKAAELLFTAGYMDADDAKNYGLINRVYPDDKLFDETLNFAREITRFSLNVIELGKRQLYNNIEMNTEAALDYATNVIIYNSTMKDARAGIYNFFNKKIKVITDLIFIIYPGNIIFLLQ